MEVTLKGVGAVYVGSRLHSSHELRISVIVRFNWVDISTEVIQAAGGVYRILTSKLVPILV